MTTISAYIAAWKLQKLVAERKRERDEIRSLRLQRTQDYADYGDNGTEASWALINVENFR